MPAAISAGLEREMRLRMLRFGNLIAAALVFTGAIVVDTILRPNLVSALISLALATTLLALVGAAGRRRIPLGVAAGGSLALLGCGLSLTFSLGCIGHPLLDLAIHVAVLLPVVSYACLVGSAWWWPVAMTAFALLLDLVAWQALGAGGDPQVAELGGTVMVYAVLSTLGAASVSMLVMSAHRRVLGEVKRLEERLRQGEKLEALGRMAGGVAHDVNNQLTGILGFADLLATTLPPGAEREHARSVVAAAEKAAELPRRLLVFARKGRFRSEPVEMHALVGEVATLIAPGLDARIRMVMRLEAGRSRVRGDPAQLHSALLNLALNARDAMPAGGELEFATGEARIPGCRVEAAEGLAPGAYLCLTVRDQGVGMDPEVRERAFEPFFTTKEPGVGTGLGLASVYGTMQSHQGGVSIASAPGKGTTVTLLLPLDPAGPDQLT
ncbi:MAG: ATP-binding protein [Planctomycetes bacterium]|nr:ATP-binding protein [Planctomycetota bacterium]